MRAGIKLLSFVGIILFLLILFRIDLAGLVSIFASTNPALLLLALAVNGIAIILKSAKWKIIVNSVKPDFSLGESIRGLFVGFAFSTLTPAKLGDFVKVFYVKDDRCGMGGSLSTVVIDRLIDIVLLVSMGLVGISVFAIQFRIEILSLGTLVLLVAGVTAGTYIMLNRRILSFLLRPFFDRFIPEPHKGVVSSYFDDFFQGLLAFSRDRPRFIGSLGIGIISWIPPFFYGYLLALSLGIALDPFFFVLVIPILGLLDLLPITISGIGTRDVALIFLFGLRGIFPEQAVAYSLLYLFSYWLVALVGAVVYLMYPIKIPGTGIRGFMGL
jgi:uncharacterized protein (TIRG00374 family)